MTSAYELEWLKYQESENKKSSQEEKEEETIKIVVAKDEDEESEDIQEISMTVGGVNCVGYVSLCHCITHPLTEISYVAEYISHFLPEKEM
jgi:hypothetical protein